MPPFQNRIPPFHGPQFQKVEKYTLLANTLRAQGYKVQIHALVLRAPDEWGFVHSIGGEPGNTFYLLLRNSHTTAWDNTCYVLSVYFELVQLDFLMFQNLSLTSNVQHLFLKPALHKCDFKQ